MKTYRIVVGFDGSDGGSRALSWAVAEAAERGGTVQAVTAWQWTEPELGADVRAEHGRMARLSLEEAVNTARQAHPEVTVAGEAGTRRVSRGADHPPRRRGPVGARHSRARPALPR